MDSGDTLLTILGDILDFSKIDHNSMLLESAPVCCLCPLHAAHSLVILRMRAWRMAFDAVLHSGMFSLQDQHMGARCMASVN